MIVYGHHTYPLRIPEFLRGFSARLASLPSVPPHDDVVDLLVDFGEAQSAAVDALCPLRDDDCDPLRPWSGAAGALATAFVASWNGDRDGAAAALGDCRRLVAELSRVSPITEVAARTAEGFAHYGLMPEQYAVAAERFARRHEPAVVTCVGIRSIGAPLAHVVAAALARLGVIAPVYTVRPRGHPFDRRLELSERLERRLLDRSTGWFAIVDEGPGISGSSFAAASDALRALGIADDRIVLFPSWRPAAESLKSERGRAALRRHAIATAAFEDVWPVGDRVDIAAGSWRSHVFADEEAWPAVHPQHERRKYLRRTDAPVVERFAGLGRYGRAKADRARALADGGFGPSPHTIARGFLTEEWMDGIRLMPADAADDAVLASIAQYLAFLRSRFETGRAAIVEDLAEMIAVNTPDAPRPSPPPSDDPEVAIDGRMLPHEWVRTGERLIKTDALDHHADDFLPCARDIAWDVAGAIVEFDLHTDAAHRLVAVYERAARDRAIHRRLPFYEAAYLAYRIGYVTMAAESLGDSADGRRFRALQARYRRSLAARAARGLPAR